MGTFFSRYAELPFYRDCYASLTAVERIMVVREFVGVTYRRRYQFFRQYRHARRRSSFRGNIRSALQRQERYFAIPRRTWARRELLPAYLELIFRHYVLGFLVQLLRKRHGKLLPAEPGCYPDAPLILAALEWLDEHRVPLDVMIAEQIEQVLAEGSRHLSLYCLRAYHITSCLVDDDQLYACARRSNAWRCGCGPPLGAELEFSNLGFKAVFKRSFGRHRADPLFHNFIYFHHFFIEDVSWRLGGYLDHHVRLRRYLPLPWIGGFFEYNLVRIDYPRRYSLPLTRDAGFLARYIQLAVRFNRQVAPHSLHVNIESDQAQQVSVPTLEDYLCLLLLGGDIRRDDDGCLREFRFAHGELIKVVRQRDHESFFDHLSHRVTEFAFLRLSATRCHADWLCLLLTLVAFARVSDFSRNRLEPLEMLCKWAFSPRPVAEQAISAFVAKIDAALSGMALDENVVRQALERLKQWLDEQNQRLEH